MRLAYNNPVMRELALQLRFAPQQRRLEQLNRAEALLHELEPGQTYSYSFICQRITGFRPESHAEVRLQGAEALADVRRLIEEVSAEVVLPVEAAGERVLTVDELSKLLHVSTKTISRWRRQGLVSRRFVFDGRTRLGFLQSTVDRFVADNKERVMRSARFSQMTEEERSGIVERARRLAQHGGTPSEVVRRVAEHFRARREVVDIDGVRVLFPEGWGLLRASNTQPVLVMRFEATRPDLLAAYQKEVEDVLAAVRQQTAAGA